MRPVALVTGAGKRIGRVVALTLAGQGYDVAIHFRSSRSEAEAVREECDGIGGKAITVRCDLGNRGERAGLVGRVSASMGRQVKLLVNSAALFDYDTADSYEAASLERHVDVNFVAVTDLTMQAFALHKASGTQGHVVTLLDQKVDNLNPDYLSYTLSKLATRASIRMLAQSCAPYLRVNAISPGVTLLSGDMAEPEFEKAHKVAALGKSSTPTDIAQAICMLERARAITGQTIAVDGGQHLVPLARDVAFTV